MREGAHYFQGFAENAEIVDWVADGAVWIEPLSGVKFPDKQGKNREFMRFQARSKRLEARKVEDRLGFFGQIP